MVKSYEPKVLSRKNMLSDGSQVAVYKRVCCYFNTEALYNLYKFKIM